MFERSEILEYNQFQEMINKVTGLKEIKLLMRLDQTKLISGNLEEDQLKLYELVDDTEAFLVIILTNFNKTIAFFVPHKFIRADY